MVAASEGQWTIARVKTGVPGLDTVLAGGLTRGGSLLIVGGPGTGKTVLAEQMAFHWGGQGHRVLWLVTLGEPNEKFLTHLAEMRFFDRRQVGDTIQLINLSRFLRQGAEAMLGVIRETLRSNHYDFAVIDGFQSLRCFLAAAPEVRLFLSELSSEMALMGISLIITSDSDPRRYWEGPEFAMADAIIALNRTLVDGHEQRDLQVLKVRGRSHIGGHHSFEIDSNGITVHPRIETVLPTGETLGRGDRQPFGVPGLDTMLDGGPLEGSTTLLMGSLGTGKSLLADYFLAEGVRRDQRGLLISFFETEARLLERSSAFHLPLDEARERGLLHLRMHDYPLCNPDACAEDIRRCVEELGVRRLVIDGIEPLEQSLIPQGRVTEYLAALVGYLRLRGVTTVVTFELRELVGDSISFPSPIVGQVAGNLILLRYAEVENRVRRFLTIVKTRYSRHSDGTAEIIFAEGVLRVVPHTEAGEAELAGAAAGTPFAARTAGHYQT